MFTRLMYVTLFVRDQDKALDFYTKAFGFEKRADYPGARAEADRSIMGFAEKGADVISRGLPSIVRRAFAAR